MKKLNKRQAFIAVLGFWVLLALIYQSCWVFSRKTTASIYAADGEKHAFRFSSRLYSFAMEYAEYPVGAHTYRGSYFRDEGDVERHSVTIRYLIFAPGISRKNTFAGNWAYPLIFIGICSFISCIIFVRKDILADQALVCVQSKKPYLRIVNNPSDDYDVHDMNIGGDHEAEEALRRRLESGGTSREIAPINTSIYQLNPNAIAVFIGYLVLFYLFFKVLLTEQSAGPGIVLLGLVLVFIPLYVQNTNNPTFKAKIPDHGSLIFSTAGLQYKDKLYAIDDLEVAVVYLEAFRGFTYRERTSFGTATSTSAGDNNKISCRCKGDIADFTFILDDFSDYWSLKRLMATWSAKGVNVLLEKVFEDDFVIQEMIRFKTALSPAGSEPQEAC